MIAWIALGVIAVMVLLFIFLPVVAWIIVGLVLLVLAVVLLVPIGADLGYVDRKITLSARVDGFTLQLIPKKRGEPKPPKEKEEKKEEKPKEEKPKEESKPKAKRKLSFTEDELLELAKKAIHGLGKFGKLRVRRFMLHIVKAASYDPYRSVLTFGRINSALCTLAPICSRTFSVGEVDVWTDIDFTLDWSRVDFELSITLRLIQVVRAALAVAFGALGVLLKRRRRLKREAREAKKHPEGNSDEVISIESASPAGGSSEETIQAEERKETHG